MNRLNLKIIIAALFGAALGFGCAYLTIQNSGSSGKVDGEKPVYAPHEESDVLFPDSSHEENNPFAPSDDSEWLSKLSGDWVSADGQQSAVLDYRTLRFNTTVDWPDIDNRYFLIEDNMRFMTNSGYYSISNPHDAPDVMVFFKEDLKTRELTSFTLYRKGSQWANSREPLAQKAPPARVQKLLDAVSTIKKGETKDSVMKRLGLAADDSLELLGGERSMGYTDLIFSLGIDNEWMLRLDFSVDSPDLEDSDAVIRRFQIVRGYVDDVREGRIDVQKPVYPYFTDGQIVAAPPERGD